MLITVFSNRKCSCFLSARCFKWLIGKHASPIKDRIRGKFWQTWQYVISHSAKADEEDYLLRVLQGLHGFKISVVTRLLQTPSVFILSVNTLFWCFLCVCEDFRKCDDSLSAQYRQTIKKKVSVTSFCHW